jgi:hypothetical protein
MNYEKYLDTNLVPYDVSKQTAFYQGAQNMLNDDDVYSNIKWNIYYYKRYKAENALLYFIMVLCIIIIIITILKKKITMFDDFAYSVIVGSILALSLIHIMYSVWNIMFRDNQNFDEYAYGYFFNNTLDTTDTSNNCAIKVPEKENNSYLFN